MSLDLSDQRAIDELSPAVLADLARAYDEQLQAALEAGRAKVDKEDRFLALFRPPTTTRRG